MTQVCGFTQMSIRGGAMILLVALFRLLTLHRLPKRTFSALWDVTALRLLLPFTVPLPLPPLSGGAAARLTASYPALGPAVEAVSRLGGTVPDWASSGSTGSVRMTAVFRAVWCAGAVILALFFFISRRRSLRVFRRARPIQREAVTLWLSRHPLRRPVSVRQSDGVSGPLTYGILRPVILLPENLPWDDEAALSFVLYHEYTHIRRFDAARKALFTLILCAHWINPLVYLMVFLANRDWELCCDEAVIRRYGREQRLPYVTALLELESRRRSPVPLQFSERAAQERIRMIMKTRPAGRVKRIAACLAVLAAAASAFASAAGSAAPFAGENRPAVSLPREAPSAVPAPEEDFSAAPSAESAEHQGESFEVTKALYRSREEILTFVRDGEDSVVETLPVEGGILLHCEHLYGRDFRGRSAAHYLLLAGDTGWAVQFPLLHSGQESAVIENLRYHPSDNTLSWTLVFPDREPAEAALCSYELGADRIWVTEP